MRSSVLHKKSIQINTNLEPSQSKKQYELALAQTKYFKENNIRVDKSKKVNQSSISCGNITVNFQTKDQQDVYEQHNKLIPSQEFNLNAPQESSKMAQYSKVKESSDNLNNSKNYGGDSQNSQSAISPGSFYTPNSFYQQPSLTNPMKQGNKNTVGGNYSCKSGKLILRKGSNDMEADQQLSNQKLPQHPFTQTNMAINRQMKSINLKQFQSSSGGDNNDSSQKSSTNQNNSYQQPQQFQISQNTSPFSSMKKKLAKTPQDHGMKQKVLIPATENQLGEQNYQMSQSKEELCKLLMQQRERKQVKTTTNNDANTKHIGQQEEQQTYQNPSQKQSKFFTFDGNSIFGPKNQVSPARGILAKEFIISSLGKQKYDAVLKMIQESDDPLKLLNISKDVTSNSSPQNGSFHMLQKQVMSIINDDRNYLSILQYIVKCSMTSSNHSFISETLDKSAKSGQSILGITPNSEKNSMNSIHDQLQSMTSPQHTPNSIYVNQSITPNSIYTNKTNYSNNNTKYHISSKLTKQQSIYGNVQENQSQQHQQTTVITPNCGKSGDQSDSNSKHFTPSTQYTNNLMNNNNSIQPSQLDINNKQTSEQTNLSLNNQIKLKTQTKRNGLFKSREMSMDKYKIHMGKKPMNNQKQQPDLDASPYSEMSPQPNHFAFTGQGSEDISVQKKRNLQIDNDNSSSQ